MTLQVINPGGKKYELEDVLYYTDDPALLSVLSTKKDKTTNSQKSIASAPAPAALASASKTHHIHSTGVLNQEITIDSHKEEKIQQLSWGRSSLPAFSESG